MLSLIARFAVVAVIGFAGMKLLPIATTAFTTCAVGPRGPSKMFPYTHCMWDWGYIFFGGLAVVLLATAVVLLAVRKIIEHMQEL